MKKLNSEYAGGAFHPRLAKGKAGGTVFTDGAMIAFQSEEFSFQLPLDGIEMKMGGAADRLVFFSHPNHPEQTIYSRDAKILNDPQFKSQQTTQNQRKKIQFTRFKKRVWLFAACVLILAAISSTYWLKNPAVLLVAERLPPQFEATLGENLIEQYKTSNAFTESPEITEQLLNLVEPLVASIASDRYEFKFYIVQDPSLNAFALPGGHVVLHTGLILDTSRAEELLGVIAHEIAHVERQHGVRKVLESAGLYIVISGLFGDVSSITALLLSNAAFLLQQQFSRDFEREADMLAVAYLMDAGIDPSGLYDFFARLEAKETTTPEVISETLSILNTHPATSERMRALQKIIDEKNEKSYSPVTYDLKHLQALLYKSNGED